MKLPPPEARRRFTASPVARLATSTADGRPHIVPVTFAADGDLLFFAVDHKPKSTGDLRRLRNIRANPRVALLADHYAPDWTTLWWARADGHAEIREADDRLTALPLLRQKYEQYARQPPAGPVVAVHVHTWTGWSYAEPAPR
ncbi:TIGR03668 family PPOX class F420-dependent oxidoreductase [Streptomyces sp.]|uniref:TIGR03668 family PPOX class F420-dependent oxidoreductase n=1 Tax=Streptomyces sp. TaxID=1931 RepID=UPI002F3E4488